MNLIVRTRSQSKLLYGRMRKCIPKNVTTIAHTGYSSWSDASTFLHDAIENTTDMLLIIDEDVFITDWDAVVRLVEYIKINEYTHSGVPDGGVIVHRRHSFITINPFFVIFNCSIINNAKMDISRKQIDDCIYDPKMQNIKPTWINEDYSHDTEEPFAGLFYWLAKIGTPLFLRANTLKDKISTEVVLPEGKIICLHAWYSRLYHLDLDQQKRIDRIYRSAMRKKTKKI